MPDSRVTRGNCLDCVWAAEGAVVGGKSALSNPGGDKTMKTGTDAQERGLYVSECCDYETEFNEDQTFTRCPHCSGLTTWEMVDIEWPAAA